MTSESGKKFPWENKILFSYDDIEYELEKEELEAFYYFTE